jgi:hypothetical protein
VGEVMSWHTTRRVAYNGTYLPAGMVVEVIELSVTGGPKSVHNRDGGIGGDGQWFVVSHPNGIWHGQARTVEGLARLGISIGDLVETL